MRLGPVQVLVVGVPDPDRAGDVAAALAGLPADGPVRCLDMFEVTVADDGALAITGPDAASPPSLPLFATLADDDTAAPDPDDDGTWHLGQVVAPGSRAVVALLEHRWALGLRDTLVAAGAALQQEAWLDEDDRATLELLLTGA